MPSNLTFIRFEQGCHGIVIAACLFMYICTTRRLKARWLRSSLSKTADLKVWATNSHQHFFWLLLVGMVVPYALVFWSALSTHFIAALQILITPARCVERQSWFAHYTVQEVDDVLYHDENEGHRLLVRQSGRHVSVDTVQSSVLPDGCSCSVSVSGEFADR